jgi:hypothetical protein
MALDSDQNCTLLQELHLGLVGGHTYLLRDKP